VFVDYFGMTNSAPRPSWFDLKKYRPQRELDLLGWLVQIGLRRDLLLYLGQGIKPIGENIISLMTDLIHGDPILDLNKLSSALGLDYSKISPSIGLLYSDNPQNSMAVHPTTLLELYRHRFALKPAVRKHVDGFYSEIMKSVDSPEGTADFLDELDDEVEIRRHSLTDVMRGGDEPAFPYLPEMGLPLYASYPYFFSWLFFSVDISLPDKLLIDHFQKSLQVAREYLSKVIDPPLQFDPDPASEWANEQLLAYLDLTFQKNLPDGMNLSKANIAELLWAEDIGSKGCDEFWGDAHITDTTEGIAKELLDQNSDRFKTLIAMEAGRIASAAPKLEPSDTLFAKYPPTKTRRNRWRKRTAQYYTTSP
jgi:hypothetical protein